MGAGHLGKIHLNNWQEIENIHIAGFFDPNEDIDNWCAAHVDRLKFHGIHIEHPSKTIGWSHWTDRAPPSGRQVFFP